MTSSGWVGTFAVLVLRRAISRVRRRPGALPRPSSAHPGSGRRGEGATGGVCRLGWAECAVESRNGRAAAVLCSSAGQSLGSTVLAGAVHVSCFLRGAASVWPSLGALCQAVWVSCEQAERRARAAGAATRSCRSHGGGDVALERARAQCQPERRRRDPQRYVLAETSRAVFNCPSPTVVGTRSAQRWAAQGSAWTARC